ncbi:MAG: RNA signal recognition particle [SAR86 cluster bacterium]|uniref:RNA signal recognition particle n=1 Tax=SAR86 cluster bacterium TaxID=2030880 RepID=A0A2A4MQ09_9GAMM|nr:MAG: RNA signal recognition particle [SAR86 cluster bacterium]
MYVNTYILSVAENKKQEYICIANIFAEVAKDFGAVEIFENWEIEVPDGEHTDYRKAVKAQPGEKIVMSWIIWPGRETAAKAHKGIFIDPRMLEIGKMPFDSKRMILGGFEPILSYRKAED